MHASKKLLLRPQAVENSKACSIVIHDTPLAQRRDAFKSEYIHSTMFAYCARSPNISNRRPLEPQLLRDR